jgi:hypothetical protein
VLASLQNSQSRGEEIVLCHLYITPNIISSAPMNVLSKEGKCEINLKVPAGIGCDERGIEG